MYLISSVKRQKKCQILLKLYLYPPLKSHASNVKGLESIKLRILGLSYFLLYLFVVSIGQAFICLDPVKKAVNVKFNINPFWTSLGNPKKTKKLEVSTFDTSSEMVAGAGFEPTTFGL